MTYGALQSSYADRNVHTHGEVENPQSADINGHFAVSTVAGIGIGLAVSRTSSSEGAAVTIGGTNVVGITTRLGALGQGGETNTLLHEYQRNATVLRRGYMYLTLAGTAVAGSRAFKYNTTTGVISLGTPGAGEAALYGLTLEESVTTSGTARVRVDDVRSDPGYVVSVSDGTNVANGAIEFVGTDPTIVVSTANKTVTIADQT